MIPIGAYFIIGIVLWGAWPNLNLPWRLAYFFVFPIHTPILWFITLGVTWKGRLLDNPLFILISLLVLGVMLCKWQ